MTENEQLAVNKLTASKNSAAFKMAVLAIKAVGVKIYVEKTSGKGRFTSVTNNLPSVMAQLDKTGCTYTVGNDAVRGGRMGHYVMVISL